MGLVLFKEVPALFVARIPPGSAFKVSNKPKPESFSYFLRVFELCQ